MKKSQLLAAFARFNAAVTGFGYQPVTLREAVRTWFITGDENDLLEAINTFRVEVGADRAERSHYSGTVQY